MPLFNGHNIWNFFEVLVLYNAINVSQSCSKPVLTGLAQEVGTSNEVLKFESNY